MNLVIVESPAKAKTIQKYLGKDFEVLASYGHVRDLVPKEGAVDPSRAFAMQYQIIEKNERHVQAIARKLKAAETLYLATDPDREGEAIAWHLFEIFNGRHQLKNKAVHRVVFNEVTQRAVRDAIANPRILSQDLINAQQARRALDYLVGFKLSPLLWKKIRRGLSAGRVQSPALRLIVERQLEIEAFQTQEYWTLTAETGKADSRPFSARLWQLAGTRVEQFSFTHEASARAAETTLQAAAQGALQVVRVERKQKRRNPQPPFTTSTLQQEAARKLGFATRRTMQIAQQLYEGVDTGDGEVGLITYMRTDSVHMATEAITALRAFIESRYGPDQVPAKPNSFKTKTKNAQEAHEAIRPTDVERIPADIKSHLTQDQFRLYDLIWKRSVACQMIHATLDTVTADLAAGVPEHLFRATGSTVASPGFMHVYLEGRDDAPPGEEDERVLPPLSEGESLVLLAIRPEQHFTEPPPRFTEASLVKTLEEYGIGRPSTYATIISTLQDREYVELEQKRFKPTDVGRVVNRFLTEHFTQYVDFDFTARLEDELDAVSRGEAEWVPLLQRFWLPFHERIVKTEEEVKRSDVTQELLDEACPKCHQPLSRRLGKRGSFIGCTTYPACDYTRNLDGEGPPPIQLVEGRQCPLCGSALNLRQGRYGPFIGCSAYPKCRHIESMDRPVETGVACAHCPTGQLMQRKSRRGKVFYSCSNYPKCDYALWDPPTPGPCPSCAWPVLVIKQRKGKDPERLCPHEGCRFREPLPAAAQVS
ncbi:MAG: type I DNA topoisomerase [Pseudomonadota bacterium]